MVATDGMDRDDVLMILGVVPERVGDLVSGLDEPRLAYRHAPAFPTLKEVIGHLADAGSAVDGLLRRAYLDGQRELPVRASIDPTHAPDLGPPLAELLESFGRVRRRTVDLLKGLVAADWQRVVIDPQQGELTLLDVCAQIAQHELAHVSQLRNLIALLPEA
ncbi:MAG: DinB family protein [Chloroflexi bacterium]|nr:MAG: DinB family protein [Chloroflexota bacterium]